MIIIFKIIGVSAAISAITTLLGMKLVEWWECGKRGRKMICDNCGENFEITHKDMKERMISKEKGMCEKYFLCPYCKAHYHIITTDAEMRQAMKERAKIRAEIDKLKGKSQSERKIRELIEQDVKLKYFLLRREKYLDKVSIESEAK